MALGLAEWRKLSTGLSGLHPALWFTPDTLPVVGLGVVGVQDILYALRAADVHGRGIAEAWLRACQCAQLAHDRLLNDLQNVDRNLGFWQQQVAAGGHWSHSSFMLLSRGPLSFAADVADAAKRLNRLSTRLRQAAAAAAAGAAAVAPAQWRDALEQLTRVTGPRKRHDQLLQGEQGGDSEQVQEEPQPQQGPGEAGAGASATDMMQQRVLLLRTLRSRLARALAQLTAAAGQLRLGSGLLTQLDAPAVAGAAAGGAAAAAAVAEGGFAATGAAAAAAGGASGREQQLQAVEEAVRSAVHGMLAALRGLLDPPPLSLPQAHHHHHHQPAPEQAPIPSSSTSSGTTAAASPSSSSAAAAAAPRPLSQELRELLDELRLRHLAAQALHVRTGGVRQPVEEGAAEAEAEAPRGGEELAAAAAAGEEEEQSRGAAAAAAEAGGGGGGSGGGAAGSSVGVAAGVLEVTSGGGSARAAMDAARRAAALSGPLVPLPASVRMPSRFQRYWLRYCTAAGLLLYGGLFLVRHSRLAGSDDLDRWILTALTAVRSALRTHVVAPLAAVRDELFRTFRDRPAIVSPQDFSVSRDSLLRMLADFAADHNHQEQDAAAAASSSSSNPASPAPPPAPQPHTSTGTPTSAVVVSEVVVTTTTTDSSPSSPDDAALAGGMSVLMRSYESELRRPLRNLLLGDLARALLIQVQGVKVDGEAAMLRLDQILRANELSLSLMAAMPALGISVAAATGLARLLIPRAPNPRREAVPSRLAMGALEVALGQLAQAEAAQARTQAAEVEAEARTQQQQDQEQQEQEVPAVGAAGEVLAAAAVEELRGLVVFRLHQVYSRVTALYAHADRTSRYSEWRPLHDDLLRLAAPAPASQRLATLQRIMRTYSVFQR